jgi:DNA-binding transcriptional regulator PaaX
MRSPAATARPSKKAAILNLLQRPDGAALSDLTAATGWQVHSVRAALTGLRKEGRELVRIRDEGGVTHYRLAAA